MKIAYIGIDLFYPAIEALESLGCEILEIFTCETDNVTEFNVKITDFADKRNIPCKTSRITRDDIARLLKNGCEMAVCGGYYFKIPADTDLPIVNIHPSLLPVGRGSWPMALSILQGDKKSGVTMWECRNCGHVVVGLEAPAVCPVCKHPQAYFEVRKENY